MDAVMVARRKGSIDFESRYFDELDDWRDNVDNGLKNLNGDVSKLNIEVFGPKKVSDLPPWYRDPKWLNIIFFISLAFLLLVAAVTKFDVQKIIGAVA